MVTDATEWSGEKYEKAYVHVVPEVEVLTVTPPADNHKKLLK